MISAEIEKRTQGNYSTVSLGPLDSFSRYGNQKLGSLASPKWSPEHLWALQLKTISFSHTHFLSLTSSAVIKQFSPFIYLFIYFQGPELLSKYVGESERAVREVSE